MPSYWIFKCNPGREGPTKGYSFDILWNRNGPDSWGEVGQNNETRKHIRERIRKGDGVLFYHSSSNPSAVMGTAEVVREFYEEPAHSPEPLVGIQATRRFAGHGVTLQQISINPKLQNLYHERLRKQSVVSIQDITKEEWEEILRLGNPRPIPEE